MKEVKFASAALGLIIGVLAAEPASAWERGTVNDFFTLPDLMGQPAGSGVKSSVEGLTVGLAPDNNIYAASSGVNSGTTPAPTGPANLFVIDSGGRLVRQVVIANSSPFLLGIRFNPVTKALWVLDSGLGQVLNVDTATGGSSVIATGFPANATLNALTFDSGGNGYVTDSTNGAIYKIPSGGGSFTTWSNDSRLRPLSGPGANLLPPFGANGIELSPPGCGLAFLAPPCNFVLVANTANRNIVKIMVNGDGTAGGASTFINGINAPDGIAIDGNGNTWVAANQEDEIVVIDNTGKVIAKLGDFHGFTGNGTIKGLLFPTSLHFSNEKPTPTTLYVANLASPNQRAIDSAWATQVQHYTISSLAATIPNGGSP